MELLMFVLGMGIGLLVPAAFVVIRKGYDAQTTRRTAKFNAAVAAEVNRQQSSWGWPNSVSPGAPQPSPVVRSRTP